eukprot:gene34459-24748_t
MADAMVSKMLAQVAEYLACYTSKSGPAAKKFARIVGPKAFQKYGKDLQRQSASCIAEMIEHANGEAEECPRMFRPVRREAEDSGGATWEWVGGIIDDFAWRGMDPRVAFLCIVPYAMYIERRSISTLNKAERAVILGDTRGVVRRAPRMLVYVGPRLPPNVRGADLELRGRILVSHWSLGAAVAADADPDGLEDGADGAEVALQTEGARHTAAIELNPEDFDEMCHVHIRSGHMSVESGATALSERLVDRACALWPVDAGAPQHHPRRSRRVDPAEFKALK